MKRKKEDEDEQIESEERLATTTYATVTYAQKTELSPELEEFIRKCVKELVTMKPRLDTRALQIQKKIVVIYDVWTGLLSFIAFMSGYMTTTSVIPLIPGVLLTVAAVLTLALFVVFR